MCLLLITIRSIYMILEPKTSIHFSTHRDLVPFKTHYVITCFLVGLSDQQKYIRVPEVGLDECVPEP